MQTYSMRRMYGETLVELGELNPRIVVLDGDLAGATKSILFQQRFPDRFFQCGIAEQNMMSVAAGLPLPLAALMASRRLQLAAVHAPSSVSTAWFTVKVAAKAGEGERRRSLWSAWLDRGDCATFIPSAAARFAAKKSPLDSADKSCYVARRPAWRVKLYT